MKINKVLSTWMNFKKILLSERSQTQKSIYHIIPQTKLTYRIRSQDSDPLETVGTEYWKFSSSWFGCWLHSYVHVVILQALCLRQRHFSICILYFYFKRRKSIWQLPWKLNNRVTIWPSNCTPRYIPKRTENVCSYKTYTQMFIAALFITTPKWKTTQLSINWWMNKQNGISI